MLVLNNVRNKIVHSICACVRQNRLYEVKCSFNFVILQRQNEVEAGSVGEQPVRNNFATNNKKKGR